MPMRRRLSFVKAIFLASVGVILTWRTHGLAGINYQGINYQGINYQGINYQGINYQGTLLWGIDRLAKAGPQVTFQRLELPNRTAPLGATGPHEVLVPPVGSSAQGLQSGTPAPLRAITVDPAQVQLQLGPGTG